MDYATLKLIHQAAVALSIAGFFARGAAALAGAAWVRGRTARTLPHLVDTVLLASAIGLAWLLRLNPLTTPWLAAKIVGLLAYIALGMVALKPGRPLALRALACGAALLCFAQIVAVAITKQAAGLLALA
ncbi:SirB2 family protein [uncultured Piscinibacter sp.]|uniref:SirB2 family protein n=1 Tax=uncultured Piscinibacter sp. TaxID=1131835 RepID=UPI002602EEF1|nr:SirB2 family protein [uncultured Piscinibacter sp.]